ncbi:DNA damage-binding protein 2-like [Diadema antillarum]|uniref:DNA damage-binding protein 2-like n=1 Tax=Diadema antillarum TaxID=105358 RepID=UPI003A8A4538
MAPRNRSKAGRKKGLPTPAAGKKQQSGARREEKDKTLLQAAEERQTDPDGDETGSKENIQTATEAQISGKGDLIFNFGSKRQIPTSRVALPVDSHSSNLVHGLYRHLSGQLGKTRFKQITVQPMVKQLEEFRVTNNECQLDRRVTAMEWHPSLPKTLAVGSKGGDLILWDYSKGSSFIPGIGKGGSVQALKFDRSDPQWLYTSSIDGTVSRRRVNGQERRVYLDTADWNFWYCSLDINYTDRVLVAGDNVGKTVLMSLEGEQLWSHRLHKQKVTHCEFNPKCPWLLATASVDSTVKLWDIRNISGKTSYLHELKHNKPINSAYFSPDGTRLLTTDQFSDLRIYRGPDWSHLERTITHPHRFFQHLTPIKASWHPFQELIVVGRYPHEALQGFPHDDIRSVDIFDAISGELVCRLVDQIARGIQSLNVFSPSGDALATGMGVNMLIWQNSDILRCEREERRDILRRQGRAPPRDDTEDRTKKPPKRPRNNKKLTEKLQTMKKMKGS